MAALLVSLCWSGGAAAEATDQSREDRLRAGYLLNFAKFVEWPPAAADEPLSVCFVGAAGVRAALETHAGGRPVGERRLVTREVKNRAEASGCRVIYIEANGPVPRIDTGKIIEAALTVSDAPDFLTHGGIIELFTKDNHLRFNISLLNARRAGLRIGSDLLRLAVQVEEQER